MKYIVVSHFDMELPIIFDELLPHDFVARGKPVISAGFCNSKGEVWGKSVSMERVNRGKVDSDLVRAAITRIVY